MNKTILIVIAFGALSFVLLFFVFYSELEKNQKVVNVQKQEVQNEFQPQERPLNNVDVELLNSVHENAKVVYDKPYPISWQQDGAKINVKGIYHGMIDVPKGIAREDGKGNYLGGEKVHALLLNLQIVSNDESSKCIKIPSRLIDINDQTIENTNTHQFYFPGSGGCGVAPNMIYEDQQIIFVVQPSSTQFAFLPFGNTEKILHVMIQGRFMQFEEATSLESIGVFDNDLLGMFESKDEIKFTDKDAAPYLKITNPSSVVRIPRGEAIDIRWDAYNIDASSKMLVRLKNGDYDYIPTKVYKVSDRRGNIIASMPRGVYALEIEYDGQLIYDGEVEIISGDDPVSKRQSEFLFSDYQKIKTINLSENPEVRVIVELIDEYSYPIAERRVKLVSSRPKDDKIVATSTRTDKSGKLEYLVTSEEEGVSKLYLEIDGVRWSEALILNVVGEKEECEVCEECEEE